MNRFLLNAADLDPLLTADDQERIAQMERCYSEVGTIVHRIGRRVSDKIGKKDRDALIDLYNRMGIMMQDFVRREERLQVYSFETPREIHGEASRLIAKLRDLNTGQSEFVYYIQRAYELLFNLAYAVPNAHHKNHLIVETPVNNPIRNFAVHKIPDIDRALNQTVVCVMLRGALLPSMIMSKEIQEYSANGYITPFALFSIHREEGRTEKDMRYILELDHSYFQLETLDGKELVFADPVNATGGSLVTVLNWLLEQGVRPRGVRFFNVISSFKGALRMLRALDEISIYALWMDPALNDMAFIMPGIGDAGDRINGADINYRRDIIQLIADYGSNISQLYRAQVQEIEKTVLRLRTMVGTPHA